MELIDDSNDDEDIFSPTSNTKKSGLDGLFVQKQSKKSEKSGHPAESLKYQAPTKNDPKQKSNENLDNYNPPAPIVINAFTWDGKAYKPVGKLGLTLMAKDDQAQYIYLDSKTLSTFYLWQSYEIKSPFWVIFWF